MKKIPSQSFVTRLPNMYGRIINLQKKLLECEICNKEFIQTSAFNKHVIAFVLQLNDKNQLLKKSFCKSYWLCQPFLVPSECSTCNTNLDLKEAPKWHGNQNM